jgi:hypothetical protein
MPEIPIDSAGNENPENITTIEQLRDLVSRINAVEQSYDHLPHDEAIMNTKLWFNMSLDDFSTFWPPEKVIEYFEPKIRGYIVEEN